MGWEHRGAERLWGGCSQPGRAATCDTRAPQSLSLSVYAPNKLRDEVLLTELGREPAG